MSMGCCCCSTTGRDAALLCCRLVADWVSESAGVVCVGGLGRNTAAPAVVSVSGSDVDWRPISEHSYRLCMCTEGDAIHVAEQTLSSRLVLFAGQWLEQRVAHPP
jgi:hypothetical protein